MTFILGVNLSDKIYLAADSMISHKVNGAYKPAGYCVKLISMAVEGQELSSAFSCMFSGNKFFIDYIFTKIDYALSKRKLSTDINELISQIDPFMKQIIPKYHGSASRIAKFIFAGCSNAPNSVKHFNLENLNNVLGPQAGHIDDINAVHGIQYGFLPDIPDQKIFSYVIDERTNQFGIEEIGEMYSIICGGSKNLTKQEKYAILRHFLNKRDEKNESKDIINFLRNQFSDSIGGAVTLGVIDKQKRLIYYGYDIDRSNGIHHKNWSLKLDNRGLIATDPQGKEYNLVDGFYNSLNKKDGNNLELFLNVNKN